jgi:hypothetical protein
MEKMYCAVGVVSKGTNAAEIHVRPIKKKNERLACGEGRRMVW